MGNTGELNICDVRVSCIRGTTGTVLVAFLPRTIHRPVCSPEPSPNAACCRLDHDHKRRIENSAGLFWVERLDQLGRPLDIREQGGHRLAFTFNSIRGGSQSDGMRRTLWREVSRRVCRLHRESSATIGAKCSSAWLAAPHLGQTFPNLEPQLRQTPLPRDYRCRTSDNAYFSSDVSGGVR